MSWEIRPYVGLGDLTFDLDIDAVKAKLGQPSQQRRMPSGRQRFVFGSDKPAVVFENGRLVEIATVPDLSEPLVLGTTSLYEAPSRVVLESLSSMHGDIYERNGFLVFLSIGITLTGFHDENSDQKAVVMFRKGFYWEAMINDMKKFTYHQ